MFGQVTFENVQTQPHRGPPETRSNSETIINNLLSSRLNHDSIPDAEPKYLIAVQPIPVNDVKKQCTGTAHAPTPSVTSNNVINYIEKSQIYAHSFESDEVYLRTDPCDSTGNVNLEKPLHLVIGSVTPTSVLLSWGTFLKTPYEGDIMNDCLEDG